MTLPRAIVAIVACVAFAAPCHAGAGTLTTLYRFGSFRDGSEPNDQLLLANGLLYGTTTLGGRHQEGTLYSIDPVHRSHTVLFDFSGGENGQNPNPVILFNGLLYGTTFDSPGYSAGTVFTFDTTTNTLHTIYTFEKNGGGIFPVGALAAAGGTLYGTTYNGGPAEGGALFALNPATGATNFIHYFNNRENGRNPGGVCAKGKILYGATEFGGIEKNGTIFDFDLSAAKYNRLYRFPGGADGSVPSGMTLPRQGTEYGFTAFGGPNNMGVLYQYDLAKKRETVLHGFTGGTDGGYPGGDPVPLLGLLYGTTGGGGKYGEGTIFRFDPKTRTETVLYNFTGGADGGQPSSGLLYNNGTFYGTTAANNKGPVGSVFAFKP